MNEQMNENFMMQTNKLIEPFTMAQAKVEDTAHVLALLVESAEWFQANGSTQWNGLL